MPSTTKSWYKVEDGVEWILVYAADEDEAKNLALADPYINPLHKLVVTRSRGPNARDMGLE